MSDEPGREKGETLANYRIRMLEGQMGTLQKDTVKIKERLMIFFFILLASNLLSPELAAILRLAIPFT